MTYEFEFFATSYKAGKLWLACSYKRFCALFGMGKLRQLKIVQMVQNFLKDKENQYIEIPHNDQGSLWMSLWQLRIP